jgi:four helix bundle protein
MKNYKNFKVWKRSHLLSLRIYKITKEYPKEELFGVTSQIRRASSSVATNIAEGCGRKTDKEFSRFCQISAGSASEVDYLLLLSYDLGYINEGLFKELQAEIIEIRKMLTSLIKTINRYRN